jgi:hypothetical protein
LTQLTLDGAPAVSKKEQREAEERMLDVLHVFTRPIIVWPGYQDMAIPPDIRSRITTERLRYAMVDERSATEEEAMWYISTASLINPLGYHWTNIFMYLTRRFLKKEGRELPDFLRNNIVLDDFEERQLKEIRDWIYRKSVEAVKESQKRKQNKNETCKEQYNQQLLAV